ncbi:MAG: hypothetical protein GXP01_02855, partial [Alphaproteobacteria bacterium]|nr:hypothetical protein [Alphaproteobacteria bacterium]
MTNPLVHSPNRLGKSSLAVILLFWLVISAIYVLRTQLNADQIPLLADTDDAMRLVQVRDLLAGQSWFDTTQTRLNPPGGTSIHWSRLIDAPIALTILAMRPLFGAGADIAATYAWPLMLLLGLLFISGATCVRLLGRDGLMPGLVLPVLSAALMVEFSPGKLDHHNAQIVLSAFVVYAAMRTLDRPRWAVAGGLAAAISLTVGTETLPIIAAAILVCGLIWVVDPARKRVPMLFGAAFGLGTIGLAIATLPIKAWTAPACDAMSLAFISAAAGAGLVLALVPAAGGTLARPWQRFGALGVAGGILLAALVLAFPQCLGGPYAELDPWLVDKWLSRVTEAKPLWVSLAELPAFTWSVALPPILATLALGVRLWHGAQNREIVGPDFGRWMILGAFLVLSILVMIYQIRGARVAAILAVPAGAAIIVAARKYYLAKSTPLSVSALVGAWLVFSGIAVALAVNSINLLVGSPPATPTVQLADTPLKPACFLPASFSALSALAPTTLMAPADLGAHILVQTPHSVIGAPYHRNQRGLIDTFQFFNGPPEAARGILNRRGITLVAMCTGLPELALGLEGRVADSVGA